jgi:hypothetical protein
MNPVEKQSKEMREMAAVAKETPSKLFRIQFFDKRYQRLRASDAAKVPTSKAETGPLKMSLESTETLISHDGTGSLSAAAHPASLIIQAKPFLQQVRQQRIETASSDCGEIKGKQKIDVLFRKEVKYQIEPKQSA